jgi:hypothetical protein
VPVASALGESAGHSRDLGFAPANVFIAYETGHLELLSSAAVYAQMRRWLVPARAVR